jgi:para-nitrobenzyl esterase
MFKLAAFAVTLLAGAAVVRADSLAQTTPPAPIVVTEGGAVRGAVRAGVTEFLGIPYAAPPVGALRWAAPAPAKPWVETRDATAYRNGCPQTARYGLTEAGYNEDCLFVNVTVPAGVDATHPRPVIAWIYGGAFVGGSSAIYPLSYMATSGNVVVVSLNYRIGVFGFMPHPAFGAATNGAYGLADQRAALRWVQRNIAKFGGDPHQVTVAGESAGGASICMQLLAPGEATGLFSKAIIASGPCTAHLRTVDDNEKVGLAVGALAGCPGASAAALACLRATPVKTLVDAGAKVAGSDLNTFVPTLGAGGVMLQGAEAMRTGKFVHVPILDGGNEQEMRLYVAYAQQAGGAPVSAANYVARLEAYYPGKAEAVAREYPVTAYSSPSSALGSVLSDYNPTVGLNNCNYVNMATDAAAYVPVFEYEFADPNAPPVTPNPGWEMGAVHSAELPYQFPHFSNTTKLDGPDLAPSSQVLATTMMAYFTSFATTGTPAAPNAPAWPAYRSASDVMLFAPGKVGLYDAAIAHKCAFWRGLYPTKTL